MALARHVPVLREPILKIFSFLDSRSTALILDATCGTGGHTQSLCDRFPQTKVVGVDADQDAVREAQGRLQPYGQRVDIRHMSFSRVSSLPERFDAILADVGIGSHTMADRGFSYKTDGPLDMRFNADGKGERGQEPAPTDPLDTLEEDMSSEGVDDMDHESSRPRTAGHILTRWPAWRLRALFETYGDLEPELASAIASAIVCWRHDRQLKSSLELRHVIELACTCIEHGQNKADKAAGSTDVQALLRRIERRGFSKAALWVDKKSVEKTLSRLAGSKPTYPREVRAVFQSLRIVVNDELAHLAAFLQAVPLLLKPGGTFAIIAYQPQESDLVVAASRALVQTPPGTHGRNVSPRWQMHPDAPLEQPLRPTLEEVKTNRRARSARLYVLQRHPSSEEITPESERLQALSDSSRVSTAVMSVMPRLPNRAEQMAPVRPLLRFTHKPADELANGDKTGKESKKTSHERAGQASASAGTRPQQSKTTNRDDSKVSRVRL